MIHDHLMQSAEVKRQAAEACADAATDAAALIAGALKGGGKLMICGNGGSAGDAQHLAAEFVAVLDHAQPRPALAALALTTDSSFLTAYSNDFGFEGVFARQIEALGREGDVLLAISTSGSSENMIRAAQTARAGAIKIIGMTGTGGGRLAGLVDILIAVPSAQTMFIQECHIALGHAITAEVEHRMKV